jgi:hypothetical protein
MTTDTTNQECQRISFQGQEYLLIENAIATPEQYINGRVSHACLKGKAVYRYNKEIGTIDDIEFLGSVPLPKPSCAAWLNVMDAWLNALEQKSFTHRIKPGTPGRIRFRRYGATL